MQDDTQTSVWNIDAAILYTLCEIKKECIIKLEGWDLEGAYWKLRILRMELDAKFSRGNKKIIEEFDEEISKQRKKDGTQKKLTEKEQVDEEMKIVEGARTKYNSLEFQGDIEKGEYYLVLENFYMYLCHLMKKHGLYFREGEDMRLAVLRR